MTPSMYNKMNEKLIIADAEGADLRRLRDSNKEDIGRKFNGKTPLPLITPKRQRKDREVESGHNMITEPEM